MSEWQTLRLDEIGRIVTGKTPPTSEPRHYGGTTPFVTPSDMDGRRTIDETARTLTTMGVERVRSSYIVDPAISVSCIGSDMGKATLVDTPFVSNQQINSIIPRPNFDRLFVYYNLSMRKDEIRHKASGAAQPIMNKTDFGKLAISLPELSEQRAISATLNALDDKIELNRRMNGTLEAQARALFRDWFVDFGPVKAKMAGGTPYLAPDLWSLFPDSLNDEGLPEGWKRSTLGQILNVLETGKRPRGGVKGIEGGTPSVGAESIAGIGEFDFTKTKFVPSEFAAKMNKGKVGDRDVLVYKDGGKPGELRPAVTFVSCGFPFSECVINEHVFRVRSQKMSQEALYCILTTEDAFWQMKERATGVAQPGLNQEAMRSIEFVDPCDDEIWKAIHSLVSPLFELCNRNALNSKGLAQTRDLLLPKLMSGEIRVGDLASEELSAA